MNNKKKNIKSSDLKEESVTREINLDELYDGAINNTVIIDPVTKQEMLILNKKVNFTIVLVAVCILILLVLYYINNKTNLINEQEKVKPNITTTTENIKKEEIKPSGSLSCKYNLKNETDTQFVLFDLVYENGSLKNSNYNYNLTITSDNSTDIIEDLKNQYESLYINNSLSKGNVITFEKDEMNFSLNILSDYTNEEFKPIDIQEEKTSLFVPILVDDSYLSIKEKYENIGFSCSLIEMEQ